MNDESMFGVTLRGDRVSWCCAAPRRRDQYCYVHVPALNAPVCPALKGVDAGLTETP